MQLTIRGQVLHNNASFNILYYIPFRRDKDVPNIKYRAFTLRLSYLKG